MRNAARLARYAPEPLSPGAMLIIPPRSVMDDELRLARLEDYLDRQFPRLDLVISGDRRLAGEEPAVGFAPRGDGRAVLSDPGTRALVDQVLNAVETFVHYGHRQH